MKPLRRFLDKQKPKFEKGGKLYRFHSFFEAMDTFLFVQNKTTRKGSHIRDNVDMKRAMIVVIIALFPAFLFGMWNIGYQHFLSTGEDADFFRQVLFGAVKLIPILVVTYVSGLTIEIVFAQIRRHEVNEGFFVTGFLIPLIVPPDTPLWMVAIATAFAVLIGKEVFGGTGMNIMNPALLTRAFLFFAYPGSMSGDVVWIAEKADAYSGATPLAQVASGDTSSMASLSDMFFGFIPGSIGETSTAAILIGALILIITGIGSLRIMVSVFAGGFLMGLLLNAVAVNPYMELPAHYHLVMGGFAFGAVFMATDPVTAAQTGLGKIIFGFLIGVFAVLIRVLNPAYPEGMMLAILLFNVFAPLIDHYVVAANVRRRIRRAKIKINS
ncbi:MAG: NADH:ubiquinone reductase (Na(+)-transporting) subunit B [Bacteroidetes bacterium]|nr:NADH:ubiquinone reductase (Na(+)-transporting) subunit B [Bacteroidota bacterium]MBU1720114.1 NADH:ubiquinone reductase (Na(+)-transporting) subunit B [Bacteroidota bacterium]